MGHYKQLRRPDRPRRKPRILGALHRGASRRDVLAMLMAGGMQAALAGSIAGVAATAHAQTPRKGGRIKVAGAASGVSDTLDPAKGSNHTDYIRACMFYNGLTSLDGSLAPQLELAEEFTHARATVWTIKLRKGVTFHDGKPLTAADVVYSLIRHKDPAIGSKAKALADQIEEVKATGPHEVTIRLTAAQRRPAGDPRHLPLPHRQGRHHRLQRRHRHRPLQVQGVQAGRALDRGAQRELLEAAIARSWTRSSTSASATNGARQRAAVRRGRPDRCGQPALSRPVSRPAGSMRCSRPRAATTPIWSCGATARPGNNPDFVLAMKYLFDREQMSSRSCAVMA